MIQHERRVPDCEVFEGAIDQYKAEGRELQGTWSETSEKVPELGKHFQ